MDIPALSLQCHQWVMIYSFGINTDFGNKSQSDPLYWLVNQFLVTYQGKGSNWDLFPNQYLFQNVSMI